MLDIGAGEHQIKFKTAQYGLTSGQLYQKSNQGPDLRCIRSIEAEHIMISIHDGDFHNHYSKRSLVHKL